MSRPDPFNFGSYPEDGFFERVAAQVTDDHRDVRARNRKKREVWKQAPAMQFASNLLQGSFGLEPEGEEEFAEMLRRMADALHSEPLVGRYQNHLDQPNAASRSNTEWWHALGHQYIVALCWAAALSRAEASALHPQEMPVILDERLWTTGAFKDTGPREISYEWVGRTLEAKTYLWHQNTLDAALAAPLVPHVVQPNAMPFDSLFFSFEHAAFVQHHELQLNDADPDGTLLKNPNPDMPVMEIDGTPVPCRSETWWVMLSIMGDAGVMLTFDRQFWSEGGIDFVPQQHHIMEGIPWGARWPEDFEHRQHKMQIGAVLRMLAFMQAPFVDTTPMARSLPRPIRREYDRAGKNWPTKEVSIITLRAALHEPLYRNGTDGEGEIDHDRYKHSWWVNGHYRWQWYPSEKNHKLIAIAQYMKQIGKPLLPQIRDVSR